MLFYIFNTGSVPTSDESAVVIFTMILLYRRDCCLFRVNTNKILLFSKSLETRE